MIALSVSRQGTIHKSYGVVNQDRTGIFHLHGQAVAAILCDGVSLNSQMKFSRSEIAARFCVKEAGSYLEEHIHSGTSSQEIFDLLPKLFDHTEKELARYLEKRQIDHSDCLTTMIVVAYRKGEYWAGIAGDGGILCQRTDGSVSALLTEVKTSPMVYPLSSRVQWKFFSSKSDSPLPVSRILVATDGVFDSICAWNGSRLACDIARLREFWAVSKVRRNKRMDYLNMLLDDVRSGDDLSCAVLEDSKYFR